MEKDWSLAMQCAPPRRRTRISVGSKASLMSWQPTNRTVSYIVLRLADDSFVHVSFHNHGDDEVNPIASIGAFAHFQDGHADRRDGAVDQQTAELVGAYITTID